MIRVTFIDGNIEVYESEHQYHFNELMIKKLEKQVKDLTAQEIYKIFNNLYANELDSIDVCEDRIAVNWFDYGEKTYSEYFNDDYIDITDLVKEQGNE